MESKISILLSILSQFESIIRTHISGRLDGREKQIGKSNKGLFKRNLQLTLRKYIAGFLIIDFGVVLAASGGGWDITNHLLDIPEDFFSPPHGILYLGVMIVVSSSFFVFLLNKKYTEIYGLKDEKSNSFLFSRLLFIGSLMTLAAGPLDFTWHSFFGLDGLLSPPHLVLTAGLLLCSLGSLFGIIQIYLKSHYSLDLFNYIKKESAKDKSREKSGVDHGKNNRDNLKNYATIFIVTISAVPLWLTCTGLIHMFTLPFSETDYYNFNPNPIIAVILASSIFPLVQTIILHSSFELAGRRFGSLTLTGAAFITIGAVTSILPNESILHTIPFYVLLVIPIAVSDVLLKYSKSKFFSYLSGAIIGLTFIGIYFPLITYTYNEVIVNQPLWPPMIADRYVEMADILLPLIFVPSALMGIIGHYVAEKFSIYIRNF